jgi:hypothetical protein
MTPYLRVIATFLPGDSILDRTVKPPMADAQSFDRNLVQGTKNVLASAHDLFSPSQLAQVHQTAQKFAATLDLFFDPATECTPGMEETLEHSRESVRQFLKTGSQIYGSISMALEAV